MASTDPDILLSEQHSEQLLPNTVLDLIAGAFGVFGNCIVLVMYTRYISDKSGTRFFIPILALVDLIGCVSSVTSFHLDNTMKYVFPSTYLCKTLFFLIIMSGGFSAHLIFAIALQRYLIICRPFGRQMTPTYRRIAVVVIFLFSLGYAAPLLKFAGLKETGKFYEEGNVTRNASVSFCYFDDGSYGSRAMVPYFGMLLLLSFINIIVTSGLYIPVTKTIYKTLSPFNGAGYKTQNLEDGETHMTSVDAQSSSTEKVTSLEIPKQDLTMTKNYPEPRTTACRDSSHKQKTRRKLSIMFLLIIIVYIVSYMTSLITQIHTFATGIRLTGYQLNINFFFLRFNLLNHIANPYIYWFFDIKFRKELTKLCCMRLNKKSFEL